jgi:hypothetical protein
MKTMKTLLSGNKDAAKPLTMFDCLESRKDSVIAKLKEAGSAAKSRFVLEDTLDTVLYQYIGACKEDALKDEAASLMKAVRTAVPLIETAGETKIWSRTKGRGPEKKAPKVLYGIFLVLGLCALGYGVYSFWTLYQSALSWPKMSVSVYEIAGGVLLLFLAGFFLGRRRPADLQNEQQVEILIDAEMTYRCLSAVMIQIDKTLDSVRDAQAKKALENPQAVLSEEEISLYAGLVQASYSSDGQMALEQLEDVKHFLHDKGVELLDYDPSRESWFELLPGSGKAKTLRPAFVSNGSLLWKGLASGGNE